MSGEIQSRRTPRPSRGGLLDRFSEALAAAGSEERIGLLVLKVINLREINANLGSLAADAMLSEIGQRVASVVRRQDILARLSGSRFAIMLRADCSPELLELAAGRVQRLFEQPLGLSDPPQHAVIRIGGALYPDHGNSMDNLLVTGETALDEAIDLGVPYQFGSLDQVTARQDELRLPAEIARALDQGEFELRYQPQVDLATGDPAGMEALLRWNRRDGVVMYPEQFIPVAERSEQLFPLTRWVFNTAMRHFAEFVVVTPRARLSLNLAAPLLASVETFDAFTDALAIWGIAPEQVTIEVTETVMMVDPEAGIHSLNRYAAIGARISIDDFGTGFSSLTYLKNMPVSELKIDMSFISQMIHSVGDHTIVHSIIDLAHNFGLLVVAEGIETQETFDELRALSCDLGQGYLIGKPMTADKMQTWLADNA